MTGPVNLNRFRKDKAREKKRAEADANAARFGRSKQEKARERAEAELAARRLDGAKREE